MSKTRPTKSLLALGLGLALCAELAACDGQREPNYDPSSVVATGPGNSNGSGGSGGGGTSRSSTLAFAKGFGNDQYQGATSVDVDSKGNVFICGYFEGTVDFDGVQLTGTEQRDIFLAKLDGDGKGVWAKSFQETTTLISECHVSVDGDDNVVVAGRFESNQIDLGGDPLISFGATTAFVGKFDNGGKHVWSSAFGNFSDQRVSDITTDAEGNVYVCGDYENGFSIGSTELPDHPYGLFAAKLDQNGLAVWSTGFGRGVDQSIKIVSPDGISIDGKGNTYVAGSFEGHLDVGTTVLKSDARDGFALKLDSNGTTSWAKVFGGADTQRVRDIASDSAGDPVIVGSLVTEITIGGTHLETSSSEDEFADIFVAQLKAEDGTDVYAVRFGDEHPDAARGIAVDDQDDVYITGYFNNELTFGLTKLKSAGNDDVFIARLRDGDPVWAESYGAKDNQRAERIAVTGDQDVVIAGDFRKELFLNATEKIESAGDNDVLVLKLSQ